MFRLKNDPIDYQISVRLQNACSFFGKSRSAFSILEKLLANKDYYNNALRGAYPDMHIEFHLAQIIQHFGKNKVQTFINNINREAA